MGGGWVGGKREAYGIGHGDVHALASLGAVRMDGVACEEDAVVRGEAARAALADAVGRVPVAVLVRELVGREDAVGGLEERLGADLEAVDLRGC